MKELTKSQKSFLNNKFGSRVTFNSIERKLYGHDIAAIPGLIKPLIGNTIPGAVVQPASEDELAQIVQWAVSQKIPMTPRGKATSGYGGVLPVKQGIVIDLHRMSRVLEINSEKQTVTVEAGIIWEKLDAELSRYGLTLKLYPSSYPSSTAGGWLAQGGAGIGSFEYGYFAQSVLRARVVFPDGSVKEVSGTELCLIADMEGTTGIISSLTMSVKRSVELDVAAASFIKAEELQNFIQKLIDEKLPVWSLLFINPRMAELRNRAPLREHLGLPAETRISLPEAYIVTIAFDVKDRRAIQDALPDILKRGNGELLSREIALHEWGNRFKIMMVKRLGPSLVPVEMVVPLASLSGVLEEINRQVVQPLVKEGIAIRQGAGGRPEVVILGFIPADQRKFSYNFVFSLALTVFRIAAKYGGKPYSTGIYFTGQAGEIIGKERLAALRSFKKESDPANLMNPGKILDNGLLNFFMRAAGFLQPVLKPIGNRVALNVGEKTGKPVRDIPADVARYAYGCSQCGYCVADCDQFYGRGWESQSPRGKWYWLREYMEGREKWSQFMVDSILACTTCEMCNLRCCASLPIESSWMKLRGILIQEEKRMTFPPFEVMTAALLKEGDIWAGYRKDRDAWFPADLKEKHGPARKVKSVYFAGCTASYVEKDIAIASVRLLDAAGVDFNTLGNAESCCGTPMMVAGKWDAFQEVMKKNILAVKEAGADTVITSCPACDMMWRQVYPRQAKKLGIAFDIKTKHYSEVLAEKIKSGEFLFPQNGNQQGTVTWHDSCHIGRVSGVYEAPRDVIKAIPGVNLVEMEHNREAAYCCGSVLTLIKEPKVAYEVGKIRLDEVTQTGADKVIALCPCCEFQLRVSAEKKGLPVKVVDLAHFAAAALGYKLPDPNPEVQRQWAVFEAMIALMSPEGFAALMGEMWPQMMDAMPFKMGVMMRLMGKIPGALDLMKPMFPILFPRLMPMMMPKLMPVMLDLIGKKVPMPDYMAAQMPELMPQVMNNLLPHMIGDVVPLVTQPMIDYLRGK